MYDGIWFVNSAIVAGPGLSIYTPEERVKQTVKTIESIKKHCPNHHIFLFDSSPEYFERKLADEIMAASAEISFVSLGSLPKVKEFSLSGKRSLAETVSFNAMLNLFDTVKSDYKAKRVYKLSGRYELNDNFVLDAPEYKDAFVFAKSEASWMPSAQQINSGAHHLFKLRLWHMDYDLLDTFHKELPNIYDNCMKHGIDIEHSYWKCLNKYKFVEIDKIGVFGTIGPNGAYVED
jgi:hypothetical protein